MYLSTLVVTFFRVLNVSVTYSEPMGGSEVGREVGEPVERLSVLLSLHTQLCVVNLSVQRRHSFTLLSALYSVDGVEFDTLSYIFHLSVA